MNAAEIHNIVKHWPKEAWPNRIACDGSAFLQLVYEGPDMSPVGGDGWSVMSNARRWITMTTRLEALAAFFLAQPGVTA